MATLAFVLARPAPAAPPATEEGAPPASEGPTIPAAKPVPGPAEAGAVELPSPTAPDTMAASAATAESSEDAGAPQAVRRIFELPRAQRQDPYGPRPIGVPKLSRDQVERYALENPLVAAAEARVEAMEAQARKANWAWFPVIRASAFLSPGVSIQCDEVQLASATPGGDAFGFQYCRSGDDLDVQTVTDYLKQLDRAGVAVRLQADFVVPIYTFGKLYEVKRLAHLGVALTQLEVQATRHETRKLVAEAYAGLLLARESIRILDEGWRLLQRERKRFAKKQGGAEDWESGLDGEDETDPKDFIKLEVGEIELARRMREARKLEALALSSLWALAGEAAPPGFDLADDQLRPRRVRGGLKPLTHYQDLARAQRPEAKLAEGMVDVRRGQEKIARRNFLPDLGLAVQARYGWASAAEPFPPALYYTSRPDFSSITVALALRWNLDFHNKAFDLEKAAAEARRAAYQRDAAQALLDLEVERAYRDFRASAEDAEFAAMARDKSWQLVVSEQQRSTVGEPDFDELRKALIAWAEYEFEHFEALQQQNIALAKLERATGTVLAMPDGVVEAAPAPQKAGKAATQRVDGAAPNADTAREPAD